MLSKWSFFLLVFIFSLTVLVDVSADIEITGVISDGDPVVVPVPTEELVIYFTHNRLPDTTGWTRFILKVGDCAFHVGCPYDDACHFSDRSMSDFPGGLWIEPIEITINKTGLKATQVDGLYNFVPCQMPRFEKFRHGYVVVVTVAKDGSAALPIQMKLVVKVPTTSTTTTTSSPTAIMSSTATFGTAPNSTEVNLPAAISTTTAFESTPTSATIKLPAATKEEPGLSIMMIVVIVALVVLLLISLAALIIFLLCLCRRRKKKPAGQPRKQAARTEATGTQQSTTASQYSRDEPEGLDNFDFAVLEKKAKEKVGTPVGASMTTPFGTETLKSQPHT